jgi:hypothetical protein
MKELQMEWEEEVRMHHQTVRKQRLEMVRDIEALEVEYDSKVKQHDERLKKVLRSINNLIMIM